MEFSPRRRDNARKGVANDRVRAEVDNESTMVARCGPVGKQVDVLANDARRGKDAHDWAFPSDVGFGQAFASYLDTLLEHAQVVLGESLCEAAVVNVLVEIAQENDIVLRLFPGAQLSYQILAKKRSR